MVSSSASEKNNVNERRQRGVEAGSPSLSLTGDLSASPFRHFPRLSITSASLELISRRAPPPTPAVSGVGSNQTVQSGSFFCIIIKSPITTVDPLPRWDLTTEFSELSSSFDSPSLIPPPPPSRSRPTSLGGNRRRVRWSRLESRPAGTLWKQTVDGFLDPQICSASLRAVSVPPLMRGMDRRFCCCCPPSSHRSWVQAPLCSMALGQLRFGLRGGQRNVEKGEMESSLLG